MEGKSKKPPTEGVHDWLDRESKVRFGEYVLGHCNGTSISVAEKDENPVFPRKSGTQHPEVLK